MLNRLEGVSESGTLLKQGRDTVRKSTKEILKLAGTIVSQSQKMNRRIM